MVREVLGLPHQAFSRLGDVMPGGFEITLWALLLIASVTDLLWGKIYNATTFPFLFAGLICRLIWIGAPSFQEGALAIAVAFTLFFPLWILKALAAGDVKLLMAVGAWSDSKTIISVGITSILIGALVGIAVLLKKEGPRAGAQRIKDVFQRQTKKTFRMPFAPAFLCAYAFLQIAQMKGWQLPWVGV
jgi:prepilin peptidase CpaA